MPKPRRPVAERIAAHVVERDGCLLWTGTLSHGYPVINVSGFMYHVHRLVWQLARGPIPARHAVARSCENGRCVRLEHLYVTTLGERVLAGGSASARNARKTTCPRGHPYDKRNTRVNSDGSRHCRACDRARKAARQRAEAA